MKRNVKNVVALLMALCLVLSAALPVFATAAESRVTYDGKARDFIFAPGSDRSPTDLFTEFKEVMPGDEIKQDIFVKNTADKNVKVKIYLRSLGKTADEVGLLENMALYVRTFSGEELYAGAAGEVGTLGDWCCLGTFYSGAETGLQLTLKVASDLDNKYANAMATIDWQFRVDEFPIEEDDPAAPENDPEQKPDDPEQKPAETGDNSGLYLWIAALCIAACGIVVLLICRRGKKEN